jgi:hypothetical protein
MKTTVEARNIEGGLIEPHHEVEVISIHATSVPAAGGGVM